MTQNPVIRCDRCGTDIRVVPVSDWEFEYRCLCGESGVISWFHGSEPPKFEPYEEIQLVLGLTEKGRQG